MEDKFLYEGKGKQIFATRDPHQVRMVFKDEATAFDGKKKGTIGGKGEINATITARLFSYLEGEGVKTHFLEQINPREILARRLEIIPVEVVIRNVAAGSICRRLGIEEGTEFHPPLLEFFYKDDELGDPLVNDDHVLSLGWAEQEEMEEMKAAARRVNSLLLPLFSEMGIRLVDFKLEFGRFGDRILLGDELSPDSCRFWDKKTGEKLDKDRFRHDLGGTESAYREMLKRVGRLKE